MRGLKQTLLWLALLLAPTAGLAANPVVVIKTTSGDITLRLDAEKAPLTVANFLQYAENGHYRDTIFHRVIPGFMVQGGGFEAQMQQKPTLAPIKNEANNRLGNERGTIAMARTNDPHSATAQFFINLKDNEFLNWNPAANNAGYAVFGKVISGMAVVDAMALGETGPFRGHNDVPLQPVVIKDVVVKSGE